MRKRQAAILHIELLPSPDLRSAGHDRWITDSTDPQFQLLHPDFPLDPGWYRLRAEFAESSGRFVDVSLYPDFGSGISEHSRIVLSPDLGRGCLDQLVYMPQRVHGLRLDPSTVPLTFALGNLSLQAVSKDEARWIALSDLLEQQLEVDPAAARLAAEQACGGPVSQDLIEFLIASTLAARAVSVSGYADWYVRADRELEQAVGRQPPEVSESEPWLTLLVDRSDPEVDGAALEDCLGQFDDQELEVLYLSDDEPLAERIHQAKGRWIGVAGSGDLIHPQLPALIILASKQFPDAVVAYTDEDRVNSHGVRHSPWRKPAFDRLRFHEQDYLGRSALVRRDVLRKTASKSTRDAGWFYLLVETVLDCLEQGLEPVHLPHVLRHRSGKLGPVCAPMNDSTDAPSMIQAVWNRQFFNRGMLDKVAVVDGMRLRYDPGPHHGPLVDIIVPTRDRVDLLQMCVSSVLTGTNYPRFHVHIVDNGSVEPETHAYFEEITKDGRVRVLKYDQPFNYSAINNFAVSHGRGQIIVLLNNDIEITDRQWLDRMVALAVQPEIGAVGARLLYPDGTLQHAGVILGIGGVAAHAFPHADPSTTAEYGRAQVTQQYSAVTAACLAVRRDVYDAVGGLDESLAVAFNDVDFCLRIRRKGWINVWTPHVTAFHHESASRGAEDNAEKQARFASEVTKMQSRWSALLDCDPCYSPAASLSPPGFGSDAARHPYYPARISNFN